jgi:putative ABC transport system ATP-binding protein
MMEPGIDPGPDLSFGDDRRTGATHGMEASLFRYIWNETRREQIWILLIILVSMPFSFLMLDLPKYIVNGPIQAKGFETAGATQHYFQLRIPVPASLKQDGFIELLHGVDLDRIWSLVMLSAAFLVLVIVNGLFKYYINFYKGRLGERMLGQFRYELMDRVLRFPLSEFRRVKGAEVATMIRDEVEPLGGFIGDAIVQPVFLLGQIATAIIFILVQNVFLGLIAVTLLVVQGVVIPRLRRRQLILGRMRQLESRALAGVVGEIVDGIAAVHTNDASDYQRADLASRLVKIFGIRFELYQRKFFVKFLNNLLAQITPFLFYMVGGFLAIMGTLNIGQLVAVISAYKDLPSPVKDLIDWDQQRLDVEVKYEQIIEQFSVDPAVELLPPPDFAGPIPHLSGDIALSNATVVDGNGTRLLDNLSFRMGVGEAVALEGGQSSGAETIVELLARLQTVDGGRVSIGDADLKDVPLALTGRRISFAGVDTFFPQGTLEEAILFGIRHTSRPPGPPGRYDVILSRGNNLDVTADWIDYEAAGATGPEDLAERMREAVVMVDLEHDILAFGLNRRIAEMWDEAAQRFVEARVILREKLDADGMTGLVEPFDPEHYNSQSTIGENLIFGTPLDDTFSLRQLGSNPIVRKVLAEHRLDAALFDMGKDIASTILEVFDGLEADSPLFEQLSLMAPDQFPDYQAALKRVGSRGFDRSASGDQAVFLDLAFGYIEPRDRLGLLTGDLELGLLDARRAFYEALGEDQQVIAFYHPDLYNEAASVKDNVLMGRVAFGIAEAESRVTAAVRATIDELGLRPIVFHTGLSFNIGSGGKRLSAVQRQKLAMARALLRRPDLLLVHRGLMQLDPASQDAILGRIVAASRGGGDQPGFGVLWNLENESLARHFERIVRLENGRIAEDSGQPVAEDRDRRGEREPMRASA